MSKRLIIATTLLTCLLPWEGQAAIIALDWLQAGDGLLTRDESQSLDWLDLTVTSGSSVDQVLAATASGGLKGFRYATKAEVLRLWMNGGVPQPGPLDDPQSFAGASFLLGLLGTTDTSYGYNGTVYPINVAHGFFAQSASTQFIATLAAFPFGVVGNPIPTGQATVDNNFVFQSQDGYPYVGSYLVRAVPEPTTLALVIIGSSGLVIRRRRRWRC